jgi:hypothetical protein
MTKGGHADTWTPFLIKRLKELHAEGLKFSVIKDRLNEEFDTDITRNACIGKARRLNLPNREAPPPPTPEQARIERRRAKAEKRIQPSPPVYAPPPEPEKPPFGALRIIDLERKDCRWIYGEKLDALYCGKPVVFGSYCAEHHPRMYNRPVKTWT